MRDMRIMFQPRERYLNFRIAGFAIVPLGLGILSCLSDKAGITNGGMASHLPPGSYAMESYAQDSLSVQVYIEFRSGNFAHETHLAYVHRTLQDSILWEVGKFDANYYASNSQLFFTPIRGETETKSKTDMNILFSRLETAALTLKNITDSSFEFQKEGEKTWSRAYKISSSINDTLFPVPPLIAKTPAHPSLRY